MKNDDSSSISGSSTSGSLASGSSTSRSTFNFANFKKPPRNIIITKDSLKDQKFAKQKRKQQISENERDQQSLALDIILSGFPLKPNVNTVVETFLRLLNTPTTVVRSFHHFENKANQNLKLTKTFHHIVITFKEKSAKLKLLEAKAALRMPIRWNQLSEAKDQEDEKNPIITCHTRFSKFNFAVEKQLHRLKNNGIIHEYKFENVFYCFKQTPVSEWKIVSIIEDINHLIDLVKYKSKIDAEN